MPSYKYKARDPNGKEVTGILVAETEAEASQRLDGMGFLPLSIALDQGTAAGGLGGIFKAKEKVGAQHLVAFTRQFATIIKSGVPILTGLQALSEQAENPVFSGVLKKIIADIEGGASLSQAIDKYPLIFSELYVNSVVAGEAGGVLDKILLRLAEMMERDMQIDTNVKTAMRYPIMTVVAMTAASFFLIVFVIPKFATMYSRFNAALPLPTQVMILANQIITKWWYIALPAIAGLVFLFKRYINTQQGRWQYDTLMLRLPVFGKLFTKVAMLRFTNMLNVLNESGLPILKTLEIVSTTIGNVVIAKEIELMRHSVADGRGIAGSILNSKIFPPLVGHMIAIGEKTGAISDMLQAVSDYYDLEVRTSVQNLTTMIEPLMTAVLGVVVLGMALAIFMPMWNMIALFRQSGV